MDDIDVSRKLKEILVRHSYNEITIDDIVFETDVMENLGYSSMNFIAVIADIESYFKICMDDGSILDAMGSFRNLSDSVYKLIEKGEINVSG